VAKQWPLVAGVGSGTSAAAGATNYTRLAGNSSTTGTEAPAQADLRGTYTLRNLWARITVSTISAGTGTLRTRKGAANGGQSLSITGTGTFEDTSGTDSVVSGNLLNYQVVGATTGSFTFTLISVLLEHASSDIPIEIGGSTTTGIATSTTTFTPILAPLAAASTTESTQQATARVSGTLANARGYLLTNPTAVVTATVRKNTADTTQAISWASGITGGVITAGATVAFASGDVLDWSINNASSMNTASITQLQVDTGSTGFWAGASGGGSLGVSLTRYYGWGLVTPSATEADTQLKMRAALTAHNLFARSSTNSISATSTVTVRQNGAGTALTVSFPSNTSGTQEETTNSISLVATDLVGAQVVTGGTGTAFGVSIVSIQFDQPSGTNTNVSLAGSQPNETGTLSRILQALRSLAGNQSNETGTLTRILQALRSLAGDQPNETGTLTRIKQALRSLTGSQPNETGTLAALKIIPRSLAGNQPNETGTLTRILQALRSLADSQPNETGTLARVLQALRSLAGNQSNETGTLSRVLQALRSLAGSQPNETGTLAAIHVYTRSLTGNQPNETGTLVRILQALRSLAGSQPNETGTLTRIKQAFRSLTGSQPNETGTLTAAKIAFRSLTGSQPNETGTLTRIFQALRSLSGSQPNETGTLVRVLGALRSLTGSQPNETGTLSRIKQALRSLTGAQPNETGSLAALKVAPRAVAGNQPNETGTLSRIYKALRSLTGLQPNETGVLVTRLGAPRSLTGSQPNETGTLSGLKIALRTLTGNQPTETGTLSRIYTTTRPLTGNQPSESGTLLVLLLTQHSESTHAEYLDGPYVDHAQYSSMARITEGEAVYLDPPVGRRRV
jgi:hypothetical protein